MRWVAVKRLGIATAIWLIGCHQTISLGDDHRGSGGDTTLTTNASTTESDSSGSEGGSTTAEREPTSGGSAGGSEADGTGSETASEASTDESTTGGVCAFDPRHDGECLNCIKSFCCPETQSCSGDPQCACMLMCLADDVAPFTCSQTCEPNAQAMQLAVCIGMSCPGACS